MPKLNQAQYAIGRTAYGAGEGVASIAARADLLTGPGPAHTDDEDAVPSLFCGFLDGLLADIRKIAASIP
jgi:hypothetical protein